MSGATVLDWLLHTLMGGGALLLAARLMMGRLAAPARRQRLGEWAIAAGLLLALLSAAPAWLIVTLPVNRYPLSAIRHHCSGSPVADVLSARQGFSQGRQRMRAASAPRRGCGSWSCSGG